MDEIASSSKYKDWISVKKMDIDEKKFPKPRGRLGKGKS